MDFYALYTSVGLWNAVYVILYAITNATKLMKYSTRSTEEIFALFICIAFTVDAVKDAVKDFQKNYLTTDCQQFDALVTANISLNSGWSDPFPLNSTTNNKYKRKLNDDLLLTLQTSNHFIPFYISVDIPLCRRENSLLFLLLMLGTLWLATTLYNFNQTPYLQVRLVLVTWQFLNVDCCYSQANKRELLADYALPVAVLSFSFIGSVVFDKVSLEQFDATEVDKQA